MKAQGDFQTRAAPLLGSPAAAAIRNGTDRFASQRQSAATEYGAMDLMRDRATEIRRHTVRHLDYYLARFAENVENAGGHVHLARTASDAGAIVNRIAGADGQLVIKSKSMVSEEVQLNQALGLQGHEVVETDLGEFIIQLAGDTPSHIIAPGMHLTRFQIGELFEARLGVGYTDVATEINQIARVHLRQIFLTADVGITGVNFGVAETGSLVTVTNEGNARLTSTAPRVHIALMGIERLVPGFGDLAVMLEVLARSATGQRLSSYTNIVTGPRRPGEPDGPEQLHVVLVDNGRSEILDGPFEEILTCIRCGACLNVCPVYRQVGGHGYGSVYSGPFGAVLTPLLDGPDWGDLAYASTLCGACLEVCPVRIDIPHLLLALRSEEAGAGRIPGQVAGSVRWFSRSALSARRFERMWNLARWLSRPLTRRSSIRRLPGPGRNWTRHRNLRGLPSASFRHQWKEERGDR